MIDFRFRKNLTDHIPIIILLFAFLIRLYRLGAESLWMDEGYSFHFASLPLSQMLQELVAIDKHPPLYYLVLHCFLFLGKSEFFLRLPSVIFGVISIYLIYLLGEELYDRNIGNLASLFLALSSLHVLLSRDARMYTISSMFLAIAIYGFWKSFLCEENKTKKYVICYVIGAIGSIYSYYLTAVVLLLINAYYIYFLWLKKDFVNIRKWSISTLLIIILFLPWIPSFWHQMGTHYYTRGSPDWMAIPDVLYSQLTGFTLIFTHMGYWYLLAFTSFALAITPLLRPTRSSVDTFLGLCFFGALFFTFLVARHTFMKIFETKYLFIVSVPFWLLAARSISFINMRFARASIITFIIVINCLSSINLYSGEEWQKHDWRGAVGVILRNAKPKDVILLLPYYQQYAFQYYYKPVTGVDFLPIREQDVVKIAIDSGHELRQKYRRIWLVRSAHWMVDPGNVVQQRLYAHNPPILSWKSFRRSVGFEITVELFDSN